MDAAVIRGPAEKCEPANAAYQPRARLYKRVTTGENFPFTTWRLDASGWIGWKTNVRKYKANLPPT